MTWWCSATRLPWSWTPRAYPGVWAFMALLVVSAGLAARRTGVRLTGRQRASWITGLFALWIATDWPVGALGSGYLASAHMAQYMLYTFFAAPMLLLAVPEDLARSVIPAGLVRRVLRAASHPLIAAVVANVVLLATHAPWTVDTVRVTQLGSFVLDVVWLLGGLVMWLPIISPLPEHRARPLIQAGYLFLAAGLVPMIPGGFLTFADDPLYRLYELAPRVGGIDPASDQQAAGVLMKVGNLPLIWPVIAATFVRAARRDDDLTAPSTPSEPTLTGATTP
ncbi:cytochrome c oxidase assembly protein (plasmid) [Iamia sp. SCSIO 61187]|uniref:cytochrome c oxidase assembly protein n=1 Tax=Iamia sp. SCSIO 61187 TaxID=2722752 RepID=UPI001C627258|nr:cytochrome c oxidase assembly protein [Iamia sp. SCSIO 61187]QYG95771.1 cytochrome c oxidase assembly protein [Iamia sp. SCSIO 61187]